MRSLFFPPVLFVSDAFPEAPDFSPEFCVASDPFAELEEVFPDAAVSDSDPFAELDDFPPDSWDFSADSESFQEPVEDVPPGVSDFPASSSSFPVVDAPPDPPDA